jgi:hypothetical protein
VCAVSGCRKSGSLREQDRDHVVIGRLKAHQRQHSIFLRIGLTSDGAHRNLAFWHSGAEELLCRDANIVTFLASWMRADFVMFARLAVRCPDILILSFISNLPCLPSCVNELRFRCLHRVMREYALA